MNQLYQDGGDTLYLMDQVKDKKNKEAVWVESIALKEAMNHLPDREYDIIKCVSSRAKLKQKLQMKFLSHKHKSAVLKKTALKQMKNHLA